MTRDHSYFLSLEISFTFNEGPRSRQQKLLNVEPGEA
jgi:hypothetical protein